MPRFWDRLDDKMQENASGILGTIAFHLVLIVIFLIIKINSERNRLEDLILVDFEQIPEEEQIIQEDTDPEFIEKLAQYLSEPHSNIPVNLARQIEQDLSTDKYVEELEQDLDENRSDDERQVEERLRELEEMEDADLIADGDEVESGEKVIFQGRSTLNFDLKDRFMKKPVPVPVYKCEGAGFIEVKIVVNQQGRVVQAEVEAQGESANEICLAEAARTAALTTRFNASFKAPARQSGTITYEFIAQ